MNFYKKHYKKIRILSIFAATSGTFWVISQVKKTKEILNNAIDTSIIDLMEPPSYQNYKDQNEYIFPAWIKPNHATESFLNKGWNSLKFLYAQRLINLSKSENKIIRLKAIEQMRMITKLDNWQYLLLAHMCDANTAIGLSRTPGIDPKLFVEPPHNYVTYNYYMLVNEAREFLLHLESQASHSCLSKFINQAFAEESQKIIDQDFCSTELSQFIRSGNDILQLCVEAILHHSEMDQCAKDIVSCNGLNLLMEIHNRNKHNLAINVLLCRILANVSVHYDNLEDIFKSGWISVLADWRNHEDIRISLPAATALANLDRDNEFKYERQMYALHPSFRSTDKEYVDVVFVHGLLGGVFFTWRQRDRNETALGFLGKKTSKASITSDNLTCDKMLKSSDPVTRQYIEEMQEQAEEQWKDLGNDFEFVLCDTPTNTNKEACGPYTICGNKVNINNDKNSPTQCWPKDWLPEDCKNLRIVGVNYDTSISMWTALCPNEHKKRTLDERSSEFVTKLLKAGIGKRPIVWITHSMGGLLVKNMLCKAWNSNQEELKNICANTKAIVFYSTPHHGSRLANFSQATSLVLWPSIEVQELRQESPNLLQLHDNFLELSKQIPIQIVNFVETKSTVFTALKFNFLLVEPNTEYSEMGEYYEIPQDHLGICKPANRYSFLYQKIVYLIREVMQKEMNKQIDLHQFE